jgi:hypothetical protein
MVRKFISLSMVLNESCALECKGPYIANQDDHGSQRSFIGFRIGHHVPMKGDRFHTEHGPKLHFP